MAETEVIITKFEADLSGLDAGVSDYEKQLNAASGATDKLDAKTTELGASVGKLGPKFEVVKQSAERTHKEIDLTGQSIDQLKAKLANLTKARGGLIDPKAIAKSNADIAAVRNQITKLETSVASAGGKSKALFGSITQAASQAVPSIGGVGGAFTGLLGPIGIGVGAAVGGLLAIAKNTDAGKTAIEGVGVGFSSTFDRITGAVKGAGDRLKKFFDDTVGQSEVASNAMRIFAGVVSLGISELIRDDQEFGKGIADALDDLEDKQLGVNEAAAQNEVIIRRNLSALRDTTKPVEERLRLADEITAAEKVSLDLKVKQLKAEYDILSAQAARQQVLKGEIDDELKKQLSDTRVAILSAQAESISLTERVSARRAGIVQGEEEKNRAELEKTKVARIKADAEAAKNAEARAQAQGKVDGILDSIAAEQLARTQSDAEKEVAVTVKKFDALAQATVEGFEKIRAASPASEQAELFQKEADALVAIDAAKNAELEANAKAHADALAKTREEQLEQVRVALLSEGELEKEAINKRFDELESAAAQVIADEEELDRVLFELSKLRYNTLAKIQNDAIEKDLEARKKANEATAELFSQGLLLVQDVINEGFDRRIKNEEQKEADLQARLSEATTDQEKAALEAQIKQTQDQKTQLEQRKKQAQVFAIAAAVINTYLSASAAYASQLVPGDPTSVVRATVAAALAVAAGLLNIAKIKGAYTGEERVGVNERPQLPGTRDRYLRRVHKNEGIVDAKTNMAFLPEINAMRKGKFDDLIYSEHIAPAIAALGYGDMGTVNNFVGSDTGQRIAQSVMLAKFYDANIVGELKRNQKQGRVQVELLAQIAKNGRRNASRW